MILGIGSDLVDIRRVEKMLARFGERFKQRAFTQEERDKANGRNHAGPRAVAATYAKRFAAKEACAKALGLGISSGVYLREIEVVSLQGGKPSLQLHGGARKALAAITPAGKSAQLHVTLTDEYPFAQAFVVLSAT